MLNGYNFKTHKMKRIFFIYSFAFFSTIGYGQDFTFSQFYEMPLLRNPALAGVSNTDIRINAAYRSQWGSVTIPYQTQALSVEVRFPIGNANDFLTTGVQITNDLAGDSKLGRIQLLPVIAFHKSLNDESSYLSFAVMGGLVQSHFDPTKLTFDDQFQNGSFDPGNSTQQVFTNTSLTYGDLATGLSFSTITANDVKVYVGVAGYHFLKSKVSFYNQENTILKKRYVLNAGVNLPTGDNDRAYIYGDYIMQGGNRQFLAGVLYRHNLVPDEDEDEELNDVALSIGGAYRWADAFIPIIKLDIRKLFIGVSYDINISKLRSASEYRGGFELTGGFKTNLNIRGNSGGFRSRTRGSNGSTKCPYF